MGDVRSCPENSGSHHCRREDVEPRFVLNNLTTCEFDGTFDSG